MNDFKENDTPWIVPDKWMVAKYCFEPEVRAGWQLPERLIVHDATLRDGEQTPGVVFRKDEKIRIAHMLEDAGVHRIEGGMPAVSKEDEEAIRTMAREIKNSEIAAFVRARPDDIDLAIRCDVQRVVMEIGARDDLIKGIWGSREKAVETVNRAARHAKKKGLNVTFFLMDSARADLDLLRDLIVPVAADGNIDSVAIVDTQGNTYPAAFAYVVSQVKRMSDIPIEVHCHNKWGLGTASTLAGVAAGADVMHACVNGMGANAALEECVMGAEAFLGVETGIKTEHFKKLSQMVKEFSQTDWYKPFVGSLTSQIEVGIATQWMWDKRDVPGMGRKQFLNYEIVGDKAYEVVLGKKSGKYSIMLKALEFNLPMPTDEENRKILLEVKRISEENKRWISDSEFKKIYSDVTGNAA